jgi:lipopolysaccharide export system permease protein
MPNAKNTIIEAYIFKQVLNPVIGSITALTLIALLSQSLGQFDLIIERGQSLWVFLKITILSLPQLTGILLPLSLFIGSLVALNKLSSDNELIAMRSSGLSIGAIAESVGRLAILFAFAGILINLFIAPLANREMRKELLRIKNDLVSTLVREGEFSNSDSGLTVYVQRIDQNTHLRQIFVRASEDNGFDRTYSAREGRLLSENGRTVMFMTDGSTQQLNDKGVMEHLTFKQYSFDITPYLVKNDYVSFKAQDRFLHELIFPNPNDPEMMNASEEYLAEAHSRLSSPLYNLSFGFLALYAILAAKFSRTGHGLRIAIISSIAAVSRILGVIILAAAAESHIINFLQYIIPLASFTYVIFKIRKLDYSKPIYGDNYANI